MATVPDLYVPWTASPHSYRTFEKSTRDIEEDRNSFKCVFILLSGTPLLHNKKISEISPHSANSYLITCSCFLARWISCTELWIKPLAIRTHCQKNSLPKRGCEMPIRNYSVATYPTIKNPKFATSESQIGVNQSTGTRTNRGIKEINHQN